MNKKMRLKLEKVKTFSEYLYLLDILKIEKGLRDVEKFKDKVYWALENVNPRLVITYGNAKLPKTTAIINLGSWFNCPGRKDGFCELCKVCYDKYPEVMYKERIRSRIENEIYWRGLTAEELAKEISEELIEHNKHTKKYKVNLIRFGEVGDLRDQKDLEKLIKLSDLIYNHTGIKSYVYTHNNKLNFNQERKHLTINGSGFMVDNEYKVLLKSKIKEEFKNLFDLNNKRECICDCNNCSYCSENSGYVIIEELRL